MKARIILCLLIFNILLMHAQVTDIEGNTYKTVIIGEQEWMVENLNTTKFRNGDEIPQAKSWNEWRDAGENGMPAWCHFHNDPENGKIYGKLYNWYAVTDPRGLAPEGWQLASRDDWFELILETGGQLNAAIALKSKSGWNNDGNGNNENGFSALPGGSRYMQEWDEVKNSAYWWTSTKMNTKEAWVISMSSRSDQLFHNYDSKANGYAVRCLREFQQKHLNK